MSTSPRILFVADAGPTVGGGHVMRCLTLAGALRRQGAICGFVATPAAAAVLDVFADEQIRRFPALDAPVPATIALAALVAREWGAKVAVLDHYGAQPVEESALRAAGARLVVLDDLRRPHNGYLVVDSGLDRSAADYPDLEVLAGPDFALVRPEFTALRADALARRTASPTPKRALVALGLTDLGGITGKVVQSLTPVLGAMQLDVVLGAEAPSLTGLQALAESDGRIHLHVNTRDMAALTASADIAVGAGGSSLWERCCLGLPALTVVLADNQRAGAEALAARRATMTMDAGDPRFSERLAAAFRRLVGHPAALGAMAKNAAALCDGRGAERVAARLMKAIDEHG